MRLPTPLAAGVSAATALVLLTACGGGDEQSDASASSAGTSSDAESSAGTSDEDIQAFCTEAESVLTAASESLQSSDPSQLSATLDKAVADLDEVEAPEEISADWETATDMFAGVRDAVVGVDVTTPEGQAQVQEAITELESQSGESQTRLDAWITDNCDNA
jgi:hypothetical protein